MIDYDKQQHLGNKLESAADAVTWCATLAARASLSDEHPVRRAIQSAEYALDTARLALAAEPVPAEPSAN